MTVRELLNALLDHSADGRAQGDEIVVRIGRDVRKLESSYSDGTFILIAGDVVSG